MYFTISQIRNDRAAQLAVISAHQLGELVMNGSESHVAFETVVLSLKDALKRDPLIIAAQFLDKTASAAKNALGLGLRELEKMFGGEEKAMSFFRQLTTPRNTVRFDSIGGLSEDIHLAKNRAAMLAAKASVERFHAPSHEGLLGAEREYVDFMKSVRRSLDNAVVNGAIKAEFAHGLVTEVQEASCKDPSKAVQGKIQTLQVLASDELFTEQRNKIIQRYASVYAQSQTKDSGPGRGDPSPM